jgi:uncharacterized cupredoxin-like copper-binding protein
LRRRAALRGLGLAAVALLCAALALAPATSLGKGHARKPATVRVCTHRRGHPGKRTCRTIRVKHRHPTTLATQTTSTTTSAATSTGGAAATSTTTSSTQTQTSPAQTTTTQTTTTQTTSTGSQALPDGTQVDERATGEQSPLYSMEANEPTLAAGTLHFNVYNTDQDPHTFAIANADGQQVTGAVNIPAGQPSTPVTVTVNLPPGTYTLYCTLPMHAAEGMQTTIVVK